MVIIILLLLLISLALLHFLYNDRCLIENLDNTDSTEDTDSTDNTEDTDSNVQYQPYTDLSEDPINGPIRTGKRIKDVDNSINGAF